MVVGGMVVSYQWQIGRVEGWKIGRGNRSLSEAGFTGF